MIVNPPKFNPEAIPERDTNDPRFKSGERVPFEFKLRTDESEVDDKRAEFVDSVRDGSASRRGKGGAIDGKLQADLQRILEGARVLVAERDAAVSLMRSLAPVLLRWADLRAAKGFAPDSLASWVATERKALEKYRA